MLNKLKQNKGTRTVLGTLSLVGLLSTCGPKESKVETITSEGSLATTTQDTAKVNYPKAHTRTAIDSSTVLVLEHADGGFDFYRDRDNDGYADTHGTGFYMLGLSRRFSENEVTPNKYKMTELEDGTVSTWTERDDFLW